MTNFLYKCKTFLFSNNFMNKKDYIIVSLLTVLFTIMVFFRIGNTYAPETIYETSQNNRDIIIDFGDYISVEQLHIYLGNLDNRNISLSAFNEVTNEWMLISSENNVSSVFQWNDIDIYYKLRYLGIVSMDEEAVFNEFVFTGPSGIIIPKNINEYPALFDEQDMFYKTLEHTYMDGTMFDEIYHGRTGYEFNHQLPTYETTHPQLGKCFIALGIKLFGMTPFGWRFFTAIFGILFIPLIYIFVKYMFNDTFVASCVSIFITYDCMHFTLSRIATIDIFVSFFIILSTYYMYKYIQSDILYRTTRYIYLDEECLAMDTSKFDSTNDNFPPKYVYIPLAMCGITLGCAVATKLTGVYAGVGLAVLLAIHLIKYPPKKQTGRLFLFCLLFFIVVPLVLYTLAYIPTYEKYAHMGYTDKTITWDENGLYIGYGWTGLIARTLRNTNYMINYHRNLEATHYYSSPFYEWPYMAMPLLAANDKVKEPNILSSVSYIGNPLIWWPGILSVLYVAFVSIKGLILNLRKKSINDDLKIRIRQAQFLIISYLASYLPWFKVSRITFIYHYLPCAILTMIMSGYAIKDILTYKPKFKKAIKIYLALVIIMFFIFYPIISGYPISIEWGTRLKWLPKWILVL